MGGTSKASQTQDMTQQQNPWGPTIDPLKNVVGQVSSQLGNTGMNQTEAGAFNAMSANAQAGNPFAPQMLGIANQLLGGGPDFSGRATASFDEYKNALTPFARGDYLNPANNPYYQTVSNDISNRVNSMFAGAGRDMSGAHMQTLARGIAEGVSPLYSEERGRQMQALDNLYNAGNSTTGLLSGLSQTSIGNQREGFNAAESALSGQNYGPQQLLAIEAAKRGLPLNNIGAVAGLLTPIAQLGGTATGQMTKTGTSTMSPAQQAWGWMNAAGGLMGSYAKMFKGG